jgi:cytochrome c biogenesis protein CcmG, thiol:disulfide interchange protein DsbE
MRPNSSLAAAAFAALIGGFPALAFGVPHRGEAAPNFDLPDVRGGRLALASLRGKPVYLDFFASWCGPCNTEAPLLARLDREYRGKGLVLVGIDEEESAAKAEAFGKRYALPYDVLLDDDGSIGRGYGAIGLPVHVFIDPAGTISTYRLGEMNLREIEDAIKGILSARRGPAR